MVVAERTRTATVDLAREAVYRFLAAVFTDPRHEAFQLALDPLAHACVRDAVLVLREHAQTAASRLGFGEAPLDDLDADRLLELIEDESDFEGEHTRVFGLLSCRECPPFETEFQANNEPFFRSQQMADVCGFYRAFGLELPGGVSERPDSLAVELEFMAFLLMKGRLADEAIDTPEGIDGARAVCEEAAETFFKEHLAWWCPAFTVGLRRKAGSGVYAAAGQLLAAFLPLERARFGVSPQSLPSLPMAPEPEAEDDAKCASCVSAG